MPAHPAIEKYIRDYAASIGIDPDVAVRVAKTEALNVFDPDKPDRGGDGGSSFGPFQLHYGGVAKGMEARGLGDVFTERTGLNARDPSTWPQQVRFALDTAKQDGWRQWYGARDNGIPRWAGIKEGAGTGAQVDTPVTTEKGMSVGGAGVYSPPNQYGLAQQRVGNATTSPSGVTPPYGQDQPPEIHSTQPDPYETGTGLGQYMLPKSKDHERNWLEVLGAGIQKVADAPMPGARKSAATYPKAAITEGQAVSPVAPQDPNRRAMLAQIMANLNAGRLY
jgi:hypothetical protein